VGVMFHVEQSGALFHVERNRPSHRG
jgi:hypothetical protein